MNYRPCVLLTACTAFVLFGGTLAGAEPTVHEGVVYRVIDGRELQLDLAVPNGDGRFPAIVFLHGGAWMTGDRSRFRDEIEVAARREFVGATITYRLAKTGPDTPSVDGFPAALEDVKAAVRFLRANAAQYHIDADHIGVAGESAGGHLALLAGLTRPADGFDGEPSADAPSSAVQAVYNAYGPTDLTALTEENPRSRPVLVVLLGAAPELAPERYREASPVAYAHRDAPPILTIHGTGDGLVPVSQAHRLDAALKQAGAEHRLVILNGGHGFGGRHAARLHATFYRFFARTLKP